jgi:hypothetical protein
MPAPGARTSGVLHIATAHVGSGAWIALQLERYRRHTTEPYRAYAIVDRLDGREAPFDWAEEGLGGRAELPPSVAALLRARTAGGDPAPWQARQPWVRE